MRPTCGRRGRRGGGEVRRRRRSGQSVVEYVLGISVIAVGLAWGFIYLSDSTRASFQNAADLVEMPVP